MTDKKPGKNSSPVRKYYEFPDLTGLTEEEQDAVLTVFAKDIAARFLQQLPEEVLAKLSGKKSHSEDSQGSGILS
jgi:hypothetical protein